MAFRFVVLTCLVAAVTAGVVPAAPLAYAAAPAYHTVAAPAYHTAPVAYAAPVAKVISKVAVEDYDHNPQYSFAYDVQDDLTGDSKAQHETRNGDVVQGSYSVVDPDGIKRTVEYTSDPHNGFNAVVHREPVGVKVAAAPVAYAAAPVAHAVHAVHAAPVVHAAPTYHSAPVYHAAPAYHHAAPVAYQSAPIYHHH